MPTTETQTIVYNDKITRQFIAASVVFGIVGMLIAVLSCLSFLPAQWLLRSDNLQALFQFGWREAALFLAVLLPFAAALPFTAPVPAALDTGLLDRSPIEAGGVRDRFRGNAAGQAGAHGPRAAPLRAAVQRGGRRSGRSTATSASTTWLPA